MEITFKTDDELAALSASELEGYNLTLTAAKDTIRDEQRKIHRHLAKLAAQNRLAGMSDAEKADLAQALQLTGIAAPAKAQGA